MPTQEEQAPAYRPRPPKVWPAETVEYLRATFARNAGRIGRLWIEELYQPTEADADPVFLLAAELRGRAEGPQALDDAEADLQARLLSAPALPGGQEPMLYIFTNEDDSEMSTYLRSFSPVIGNSYLRSLDLPGLKNYLGPGPRHVPTDYDEEETELEGQSVSASYINASIGIAISAGLFWFFWVYNSGDSFMGGFAPRLVGMAGIILSLLGSYYHLNYARKLSRGEVGNKPEDNTNRPLRHAPLVMGRIVQANYRLFENDYTEYPETQYLGLVAVITFDPKWRDDLSYLDWLGRRLSWLREHGGETTEEQHVAQALDAEQDTFNEPLPRALTGNDSTYWAVFDFQNHHFSRNRIPPERIYPFLLKSDRPAPGEALELAGYWPPRLTREYASP